MRIVENYLNYLHTEQMAAAAFDFSRPYEQLRRDYQSCARSCMRFSEQRREKNECIVKCKVLINRKELRLAIYELKRCGPTGNLKCQDAAKKKILKIQKKLRNNMILLQKYSMNRNK